MDATKYKLRGVSSSKEDLTDVMKGFDKGLFPSSTLKLLPDVFGGSDLHCNILHSDGSGTKSALAYMYWKETGDLSVWKGIVRDAITMNIDDLLCAGVTDNILVSLIINRNLRLIPAEVLSVMITAAEDYLSELRETGIGIFLAGGETADIGDLVRTAVIDVSVSCRMRREDVILTDAIESGDVIIGLASSGKAVYETEYNSGIGCNGLTSARHDIFSKEIEIKFPETYDHGIPKELVYTGTFNLRDQVKIENYEDTEGSEVWMETAKLLLSSGRTYFPVVGEILQFCRPYVHSMIHCTGGGQTKILQYVKDLRIIKDNMFPIPQVFKLIKNQSNTSWKEMFSIFNMGHRFEIYVREEFADRIMQISKSHGVDARIIGRVETAKSKSLLIKNLYGEFNYI